MPKQTDRDATIDRPEPPPHGKYGAVRWGGRRWVVTLNSDGQQIVAEYLQKHGKLSYLAYSIPKLRRLVGIARQCCCTDDEIEAELHQALVHAAIGYDSERAAFSTFLVVQFYGALSHMIDTVLRRNPLGTVELSITDEAGGDADTILASGTDLCEDALEQAEDVQSVHQALAVLRDHSPRLALVMRRVWLDGLKLHEVSKELGVTRERVGQLQNEAMAFLRDYFHSNEGR